MPHSGHFHVAVGGAAPKVFPPPACAFFFASAYRLAKSGFFVCLLSAMASVIPFG